MKLPFCLVLFLASALTLRADAATLKANSSSTNAVCPRYAPGSPVVEPANLYSSNGVLRVHLTYETRMSEDGNRLYCFMDDAGNQSPTLHVKPGEELLISLTNALPSSLPGEGSMATMPGLSVSSAVRSDCGGMVMTNTSVNLHYHGTNTAPVCHQDEVIKTLINSGETFVYDVKFPKDEPPGLYWYHPHVHMLAERTVQGGATGAIVVEGIENLNADVAGLPERTVVIRDYPRPETPNDPKAPAWNVSVNYVPVPYPSYKPAVVPVRRPGGKEFWRVVNASADTILDLAFEYDGVAQTIEVVALDGVPVGSQDGTSQGKSLQRRHLLLPPASRAEFILTAPGAAVESALLLTRKVDTGPDGDSDPKRPLAVLKSAGWQANSVVGANVPAVSGPGWPQRFAGLASTKPTQQRKLYFSETPDDPSTVKDEEAFFITVEGQTPTVFSPDNPPAITTTQDSVEDWTIENRSQETHTFHIHQIHFLVLAQTGEQSLTGQYIDTINVPFWSGSGPYPSVKLRMDFRGRDIGDFVYHCHILEHEDGGMMAIIRVLPKH